jgi:hypothetical protein
MGIKGPGQMIGKMVWEQREKNPVLTFKAFEEGKKSKKSTKRRKRIKK